MSRTAVYFTVDCESSMGGAWDDPARRPVSLERRVFGRTPEGDFGLPLIVDELMQRGLRGTFFVETLASHAIGIEETARMTDYLLARDQDVQLHAHPTFRHYHDFDRLRSQGLAPAEPWTCDQFSGHDEEWQLELLSEAADLLRTLTGRAPQAFRAGGFAADHRTLRCLRKLGIVVDSSWNPVYRTLNASFPDRAPAVNRPEEFGGVWEMPVTVARTMGGPTLKHADPSAISAAEMRTILDESHANGLGHVVIVFHCFSTVKTKDFAYSAVRPNRIVISRLRETFDHIAGNPDRFEMRTLGDLAADPSDLDLPQPDFLPGLGIVRPVARKVVQAVNNTYWV